MNKMIALIMLLALALSADSFTNSIGMKFSKIPAGSFMMGAGLKECPKNDPFTNKDESECMEFREAKASPTHKVTLKEFYMGTTEVTQAQWYKIMGWNNSYRKGRNNPVTDVKLDHIRIFIKKLNELESTKHYSLPSEAQWEYTARAGTSTSFPFKNTKKEYLKRAHNNGANNAVGTKLANKWGIYDMFGNAEEYTQDAWHKNYKGAPSDGRPWMKNPDRSDYKVLRGASRYHGPKSSISIASWTRELSFYSDKLHGFRLAYSGTKTTAHNNSSNEFTEKKNISQESKKKVNVKGDAKDANFFNSLDNIDNRKPVNIQ